MKLKRALAYFIDLFLISFVTTIIFYLPFFSKNLEDYNTYTQKELDVMMGKDKDISEDELNTLDYNVNRSSIPVVIINSGLLFIYFGVVQYGFKGQTIGKKICKLKVVSNDRKSINPNLFMLRSLLVSSFIPNFINVLLLIFGSMDTWIEYYPFVSLLQTCILFAIGGGILIRQDSRGIHDLIANTKVISLKKE